MTSARNTIVPIKAKTLKIIIGLALASLFLANLVIFTDVYKQPLIYSIMSAGSMIFSANENKINFIIDNNLNNQEKILRIYSINYSDPIRISTSTMSETTSGKQISSDNILFNGNASTNLIQNSVEVPLKSQFH